jgi:MoxR-like ATPase
MGMLLKAARVNAWLMNRDSLYPEDIHAVFHELIAHRLVFNAMYENRRTVLARELTTQILASVAVPSHASSAQVKAA